MIFVYIFRSKSALQRQLERITDICYHRLCDLHDGLLEALGSSYQEAKSAEWRSRHLLKGTFGSFKGKIDFQNGCFVGIIGSVDGTYSVRPAISSVRSAS